jgi:hypothetical protein
VSSLAEAFIFGAVPSPRSGTCQYKGVSRYFVDRTLWPEYQELREALNDDLNDATERISREEVYGDAGEASERAG